MLSRKTPAASKGRKKTILGKNVPKSGTTKAKKNKILTQSTKAHVAVRFDDADLVNSIALQQLSEEEMAQRVAALAALKQDVINDERLPLRDNLLEEDSKWVFYRGVVNANLMIVGEGPGADEAKSGLPFVGASGKLMNSMLKETGLITHEHAFVTNLVYIRTSARNRDPNWEEVNAFLPYLRRMIGIVKPKLILCMGRLSSALFSKGRITALFLTLGLDAISTLKGAPDEFGVHKFKGENFEKIYTGNSNETTFALRDQKRIVRAYCSYHPAFILRQDKDNPNEPKFRERWKKDFATVRALLEEPAYEYIDVDEIVRTTSEPGFVFTNPKDVRYKGANPLPFEAQQTYAKNGLEFEVHKVDYDPANFFKIVGRTADDRSVCLLARNPRFAFYVSHYNIKSERLNQHALPRLEEEINTQLLKHLENSQPFLELNGLPVRLELTKVLKAIDISAPKWMLKVIITESRFRTKVAEIIDGIFMDMWKDLRPPKPNHKRFFPKNLHAIKTFQNRFTEIQHLLLDNNIYIRGWLDLPAEGTRTLRLVPLEARCSTADLEYEIDCVDLKGHSPNPFEASDPKWEKQAPTRMLALDAEMLGIGGKFPHYAQDPVISIAAYSNTFDRANKKNYTERVRLSAAGEGASQTRSTGRCNYDDGAIFCLGSLSEVRSSKFAPTYLPNIPAAPNKFDRGWNDNGRDKKGAYHSNYAISIRTWNAFLLSFREWVSLVGEHRSRRIVRNNELYHWLSELPVRPSGNDPTKEWKEESQILEWESRCAWIAVEFPNLVSKKDIANIKTPQAWSDALETLVPEEAEREYGTIQARWKLCRPNASVFSFSNEGDLFRGFYNYITSYDPDIISGYNSNNFDLSYFINRVRVLELLKDDGNSFISMGRIKADSDRDEIKQSFSKATGDRAYHVPRINGRDAYDLMNYVMRDVKLDSYSLASVAKYFLKDSKNDVPYSAIPSLFRNNRERLNAYCGKDAELVLMLINDTNNMNYLISLARLIGLMHTERLYVDGKQEQVFSVLMRWFRDEGANKVMNDRNKYSQDEEVLTGGFEGAHVFPPKTLGLFMLLLLCLDYNSLYPNIMRANNLGHDKSGTAARLAKYGHDLKDCYQTLEEFVNPKTGLKEFYYFLQPRNLLKTDAIALGFDIERDCTCTPEKPAFWIFEDENKKRFRCTSLKQIEEKGLRVEDAVYHKPVVPARYTPKTDVASICSAVTKMLNARGRVNRLKGTFVPGSVEYRRLDMIQMALKIICNSTYGATGVKVGKLAGMHISATVTKFGKNTIKKLAARMAEDFNADVQGGDTDSIFVHFPSIKTPEQIYEMIDVVDKETGEIRRMTRIAQILEVANSLVPPPMKIDFEKAFLQFFAIAKKRAAALTLMPQWDALRQENVFGKPKLDIKGLENKRRDSCKIAKDTITGFIERLFGIGEDGGTKEGRELCAAKFARKAIDRVDAGDVPFHEMIQSRQLSKKKYNTEVPHMVLNEKMRQRGYRPKELGERISFVAVTGRQNRSFSKSVEDPDYAMLKKMTLDYDYVVRKKMQKPLQRFTQYMPSGKKYDEIMFGNRHKRHRQNLLEDDPIFRMVRVCVPCKVCKEPSVNPVCDDCKPTADWDKLLEKEDISLKEEEAEYEKALKVCRACTGVAFGEAIDCDNGTCPSYYPRRGGEFKILGRKTEIETLQNHLAW